MLAFLWDRGDRFVKEYVAENLRWGQGAISVDPEYIYGFLGVLGSKCQGFIT